MLKGGILSKIDSCNGPIKLAYFVMPCSKFCFVASRRLSSRHETSPSWHPTANLASLDQI